jgi:enterochelin esterase-like enzyme
VPDGDDLFALARAGKARANKPELYLGVGLQDALYPANRRLLAELQADGYAVTYRESEGNHNWAFWDEYVRYVLAWMFA